MANQATLSSHVLLFFMQFIAILSGDDVSDQVHFLVWQLCIVKQSITLSLHCDLSLQDNDVLPLHTLSLDASQ